MDVAEKFCRRFREKKNRLEKSWNIGRFDVVLFTSDDIRRCREYADARKHQLVAYNNRGQTSQSRKEKQVLWGKLGEVCAFRSLNYEGLSEPDFEIYPERQKSWTSDLHSGNLYFSVKTHVIEMKIGEMRRVSWIFQWNNLNGCGGTDLEIFGNKENLLVVFVILDEHLTKGKVLSVIPNNEIQSLFDEPEEEHLRKTKKAIYLDGLEEKGLL